MPSNHSSKHVGLQEHSVGDIYPYSIKRVGDRFYQPFHCLTGKHGPEFYFDLQVFNSLARSHGKAEDWAREQLAAKEESFQQLQEQGIAALETDGKYVDGQRELSQLAEQWTISRSGESITVRLGSSNPVTLSELTALDFAEQLAEVLDN